MRHLILLALFLVACSQAITKPASAAYKAEPQPVLKGAGELMADGIMAIDIGNYELAAKSLQGALNTGQLNDIGKVLAYWNLFVSAIKLKRDGMNDLFSFIVIAEDIISVRSEVRYFVEEDGTDFVDRFDLQNKLRIAHNIMEAAWGCSKEGDCKIN